MRRQLQQNIKVKALYLINSIILRKRGPEPERVSNPAIVLRRIQLFQQGRFAAAAEGVYMGDPDDRPFLGALGAAGFPGDSIQAMPRFKPSENLIAAVQKYLDEDRLSDAFRISVNHQAMAPFRDGLFDDHVHQAPYGP